MTLNLSPTQIETFDEKQQWGCQRKWFYQYAPLGPRIRQPETQDMANGTELHHAIEAELLGLEKKTLSFLGDQMLRAAMPMVQEVLVSHFGDALSVVDMANRVEQKMKLYSPAHDDVVINGRIDLLTHKGIVDWKSKGDLGKAKTSAQLRDDHQMTLYGYWFAKLSGLEEVVLEHGVVTSKAPFEAKRVVSKIAAKDLTIRFENTILPLVSEMVALSKSDKVEDFKPKHNEICKRCPFYSQCPQGKTKAMDIAAFLAAQRNPQPAAPAPAPQPPPAAPAPAPVSVSAVLPPDAPKRQPVKLMPVDVETPPAVTAPENAPAVEAAPAPAPAQAPLKKGPGRPPGAKNKPKEPSLEPLVVPAQAREVKTERDGVIMYEPVKSASPGVIAKTVTFTQGHTVNLGDFNSVRFDISYTAECGGVGFDAALNEAREAVQKEVMVELERYSAMAAKGVKK